MARETHRPPTEPELVLQARERLEAAKAEERRSSFLPAGNDTRDAAVRELHVATAIAQEWRA